MAKLPDVDVAITHVLAKNLGYNSLANEEWPLNTD